MQRDMQVKEVIYYISTRLFLLEKKKTKAEPKLASVKLFVFHIFILFPFFKFSGMEENIVLLK